MLLIDCKTFKKRCRLEILFFFITVRGMHMLMLLRDFGGFWSIHLILAESLIGHLDIPTDRLQVTVLLMLVFTSVEMTDCFSILQFIFSCQ